MAHTPMWRRKHRRAAGDSDDLLPEGAGGFSASLALPELIAPAASGIWANWNRDGRDPEHIGCNSATITILKQQLADQEAPRWWSAVRR